MLTCYLTLFVRLQTQTGRNNKRRNNNGTTTTNNANNAVSVLDENSLVYPRMEVLAVFASTVLSQLGAMFVFKESLERMIETTEIHT